MHKVQCRSLWCVFSCLTTTDSTPLFVVASLSGERVPPAVHGPTNTHASSGGGSGAGFSKGFGGFGGAAGAPGGFTFASASTGAAFSFGSLPPAGASFPPVQSIFGGGASAAAPVFGGADLQTVGNPFYPTWVICRTEADRPSSESGSASVLPPTGRALR